MNFVLEKINLSTYSFFISLIMELLRRGKHGSRKQYYIDIEKSFNRWKTQRPLELQQSHAWQSTRFFFCFFNLAQLFAARKWRFSIHLSTRRSSNPSSRLYNSTNLSSIPQHQGMLGSISYTGCIVSRQQV